MSEQQLEHLEVQPLVAECELEISLESRFGLVSGFEP
jgi:hypothetical protein